MIHVYAQPFADAKAGAGALLTRALGELGLPPAELRHDGRGRPWLENGPEVSLSHTAGYAAVALSPGPVGVDAERLRPLRPGVAKRVMGPPEYQRFRARGERPEDFFTLWTLKESWYKYLGTGLPGFPNGTEFYWEDGLWRLRGAWQAFRVWRKDLLFLAVCGEEQEIRLTIFPES